MKPKIIQTALEHKMALEHIETLMDADPGSSDEEELKLWALLVESYEKEQFPIGEPDPIEAVKFRMDQLGLKPKDLQAYLGQKSKVSEVLNRKRSLSLAMIRALHQNFGISAETLLQETKLVRKRRSHRKGKLDKTSAPKRMPKKEAVSEEASKA